jgi:hypothetical protein
VSDSDQPSATGKTRAEWRRNLEAAIGEDPARYLDRSLASGNGRELAFARIPGIDRLEVVNAWRAAERRLATRDDREPRGKLLDLLDEREAYLQEHGERPLDLRAALEDDTESVPDRYRPSRGTFDEQDTDDETPDYPGIRERFRELVAYRGIDANLGRGDVLQDARTTETTEQAGLQAYATDRGQPDQRADGTQEGDA